MRKYSSHSGFTLLELLITASLFVVVAGLTTSIFAGVSKLQLTRKGNQALASQLRQAELQMTTDIQSIPTQGYVVADPPIGIKDSGVSSQGDELLVRRSVDIGNGTVQPEWRIYCQSSTGVLMRFIVPYTPSGSGLAPQLIGNQVPCDSMSTQAQTLFNLNSATLGAITSDQLTDSQSLIAGLHFTQLEPNVNTVDPAFQALINTVQVEMSAKDSVTDPSGNPIVYRVVINRIGQ